MAAFALKGPGVTGFLRPRNMGKNGDQIQRLFRSPAQVFVVQYHGQIHHSVVEQMQKLAELRARESGKIIYYCTIGGRDSRRLLRAYPGAFTLNGEVL